MIYLKKNGGHFEYFICFSPDEKNTVNVEEFFVALKAFKNVDGLEHVSFNKCATIEQFAFEDCRDLKTVVWGKASNDNISEKKDDSICGFDISSVENFTIQNEAFKNCSKLQTVILPSVEKDGKLVIEKEAFAGCCDLRTVVFPDRKVKVDISEDAFLGCSNVVFLCLYGSSEDQYAREHGFRIVNF